VEDGREPGVDREKLAAVQPRTLAERQRYEVVRVVNYAEPLVSPAQLVSRPLFQIEYGNLALVKVRANPVDERIGLRSYILTRSQVLVQATEPELERFDSRPVRPEHSVKVGIPNGRILVGSLLFGM
jgi:hypothetical protein